MVQPRVPDIPLTTFVFPGLEILLPNNWLASERSLYFENGSIKVTDPADATRFVSVRWVSGEPVDPDEFVKVVTGGTMTVARSEPAPVGGHEGSTFTSRAARTATSAAVTIWNCGKDRRTIWIFSSLNLRRRR